MIYLDNNATTFLDPLVLEEMQPILEGKIGNPSSIHRYGQRARATLAKATKDIASYFGVHSSEVIFTSGATEGLHHVIRSLPKNRHIISSSLEHIAVIEALKLTGCEVTYIDPLPGKGAISLSQVKQAQRSDTTMLVLMAANNETGVKTDIDSIAAFAQERGLFFVVDGVALLGKEPWRVPEGVGAVCFSGHKIHAPPGIGVTIIRKGVNIRPLIAGGAQQRGHRGGTENLAGAVGFAKALSLFSTVHTLRDYFEQEILNHLDDVLIHGVNEPRICNTSNIAFREVDGETLLMQLDLAGVAASYGAACSSGSLENSRVLLNMGISPKVARESIRFSLSRFTTKEEIDRALSIIIKLVKSNRRLTTRSP